VLYIEYMDIEHCGAYLCEYLEIEGGLSWDGVSDGKRCGYMRRLAYFSFRENLKVLFVSDGKIRYRGFRATFTQANHTGSCITEEFLSKSSGFFSSPNFPNNFPQYSRCVWNITVSSGYIIKFSFHHFELGRWPHTARVSITNVASDDGRQPFQLYGSSLPDPVYSVGNSIQVIFTSLTSQYSGFNASYKAITYESGMSLISQLSLKLSRLSHNTLLSQQILCG